MRLAFSLLALLFLGGSFFANSASAYPQFQLSTGANRCNLCHISPAGGGLLNDGGRGESADTVSQFGGNGDFLYGAYREPSWVKLGVDMRVMGLLKEQNDIQSMAVFPMQGDTYAYFHVGDFSLYTALGPRAQVRGQKTSRIPRFTARELWLMWRPSTLGSYARVGRYQAPFGLRSADHTIMTRRYLGFYSFEETLSASYGFMHNDWEVHATAFVPIPAIAYGYAPPEKGVTVLYERRLGKDQNAIVGGQTKIALGDEASRFMFGAIAKQYFPALRLMLLGESNLIWQTFSADGSPSRMQAATYLGASYWPMQGLMISAALEDYNQDLSVKNAWRDATSLSLQYFPLPHWEVMLQGKMEAQGDWGKPNKLGFLQLHYWL